VCPTVAARAAKRTGDGAHCAIIKGVMRHATIDHLIDQLIGQVALQCPPKRCIGCADKAPSDVKVGSSSHCTLECSYVRDIVSHPYVRFGLEHHLDDLGAADGRDHDKRRRTKEPHRTDRDHIHTITIHALAADARRKVVRSCACAYVRTVEEKMPTGGRVGVVAAPVHGCPIFGRATSVSIVDSETCLQHAGLQEPGGPHGQPPRVPRARAHRPLHVLGFF